jgi:hypothetical protein
MDLVWSGRVSSCDMKPRWPATQLFSPFAQLGVLPLLTKVLCSVICSANCRSAKHMRKWSHSPKSGTGIDACFCELCFPPSFRYFSRLTKLPGGPL